MFGKKIEFSFHELDKAGWLHFKTNDNREVTIAHQEVEDPLFYFGLRGLRTVLMRKLKELEERKEKEEKLSHFILAGEQWF